jgi:hypothetical protein
MFTCIFEQVAQSLGMLSMAQNLFETAVIGVAKGVVGQVTGGIWKGNGANKFVEMVNSQFLSLATQGHSNTQGTSNNLNQAQQIVHDADQSASAIVGDLESIFSSIY